jgi:hypothetical protein
MLDAAGGIVTRDLFEPDGGGWLQDAGLLDRLALEKLQAAAEAMRGDGWKWIEVALDFPYGHTSGLRHIDGEVLELTTEERATYDALQAEYERLEDLSMDCIFTSAAPPAAKPSSPVSSTTASALAAVAGQLLGCLERGRTVDAAALRSAMEAFFCGFDAEGACDWKTAYDACEAA